jgi:hypothetical protein
VKKLIASRKYKMNVRVYLGEETLQFMTEDQTLELQNKIQHYLEEGIFAHTPKLADIDYCIGRPTVHYVDIEKE